MYCCIYKRFDNASTNAIMHDNYSVRNNYTEKQHNDTCDIINAVNRRTITVCRNAVP